EPAPQIGKHRCRVALERIAKAAAALPAYREHIAALHPDQAGLGSERGPVDAVTQDAVLGCLFAPALNHGGTGIAAEQAGRVRHLGAVSQEESTGGLDAAERERNLCREAAAKGAGAAGVAREPAIEIEQRHRLLVALDVGDAGHRTVVRPAAIVAILAGEGRI